MGDVSAWYTEAIEDEIANLTGETYPASLRASARMR